MPLLGRTDPEPRAARDSRKSSSGFLLSGPGENAAEQITDSLYIALIDSYLFIHSFSE